MKLIKKILKWLIVTILMVFGVAIFYGGYVLFSLNQEISEDLTITNTSNEALPTIILDRKGKKVGDFSVRQRFDIPFKKFPLHMVQGLIAGKDDQFFNHFGIDLARLSKSLFIDFSEKGFDEGTETLTKQTAKLLIFNKDQGFKRIFKEVLLALNLERQYSKEKIVYLYLNKVFLGNAEGVEAASLGYFGKSAEKLSLAESSLLIGIIPSPYQYSPDSNVTLAKVRRNLILQNMYDAGYISAEEHRLARQESIQLNQVYDAEANATAYYVEHVRQYLLEKYGTERLYNEGLLVHLAMDLEYQVNSHNALQKGLLELSKRQGYRKSNTHLFLNNQGILSPSEIHSVTRRNQMTLGHVVKGVVTRTRKPIEVSFGQKKGFLKWEHLKQWKIRQLGQKGKTTSIQNPSQILKVGDVIQVKLEKWDSRLEKYHLTLYQKPLVNGSLFSMDPKTGHVLSMIGGYEYDNKGNRAIDVLRPPGSAFKPIIYALALDSGFTLASMLKDKSKAFQESRSKEANESLFGAVSLRKALANSLDLHTIELSENLGSKNINRFAKNFGLSNTTNSNLTVGWGGSASLQDMVKAYSAFANQGSLVKPIYIMRIEDQQGNILEENKPEIHSVISKETSFLISDALRDISRRTRMGKQVKRSFAGKTGETKNNTDAWFIGYIPQLLAGVYVGFDKPASLGNQETGSRAAAPIWTDYMKSVTAKLPTERFVQPPKIVTVKIHKSGRRARPCDVDKDTYNERFIRGTEPLLDRSLAQSCKIEKESKALPTKKDLEF